MQFTLDLDLDALLAQHGQIALLWGLDDVRGVRPDLTDDQAWEVLKAAQAGHDASVGLTFETLEWIAGDLFGAAPATDEAEA